LTLSASLQEELSTYISRFQTEGYLLLPSVLSDEKVARLNTAIDEVLAGEEPSLAYNVYNSVARHPEFASLMDQQEILPLIVNLLGHNIQLHISHLTVRHPNPADLQTTSQSFIDWHQDGPHPQFPAIGGVTPTYYIKVCYILSDMSEPDRGNTKIIPRSHDKPYNPNSRDVRQQIEGELQICGKPGDVFIFPQNLWHAGSPNKSNHTRRQLFLGYSPLWMRPIDYHAATEDQLREATPIQRQLLGAISDNKFKYYVPEESMVPLKSLLLPSS